MIEVSDGYARNYLLPRKLAKIADQQALTELKNKQAAVQHRIEAERAAAEETARKLLAIRLVFRVGAGVDGRLYGSVTAKDVAELLAAEHGITVDKRKIVIPEPIKAYGSYELDVRLTADVSGKINLIVTEK